MALIKCPECGKEISDTVKSCPNCGYRIKRPKNNVKRKPIIIGGAILIIIVVTLLIIQNGRYKEDSSPFYTMEAGTKKKYMICTESQMISKIMMDLLMKYITTYSSWVVKEH